MSIQASTSPIVIVEPTRNGYQVVCNDDACKLSLDEVAKKLYNTIVKVREFFLATFGLVGLDGKGKMVPLVIKWDQMNARWECEAGTCFLRFNNIFAINPEVVAHEYTHGVIEHLNFLEYKNQSGALNESLADVIGITFKQWLTKRSYWNMSNLRDLSKYASMKNYLQTNDDNGGVHSNSAIPNHAFYRAVQNCKSVLLVAEIWFLSFQRVSHTATFKEFAMETIEVAKSAYLPNKIAIGILKAWKDVDVLQVRSEEKLSRRWDEHSRKHIIVVHPFYRYS